MRLYTLDNHVQDLSDKNRQKLAQWLNRKVRQCALRKVEAEEGLQDCGIDMASLHGQWEAQKEAQTKPLLRELRL